MGTTTEAAAETQTGRIETAEYAAMMRRMLRGWGRRLADADEPDLAELAAFPWLVEDTLRLVVLSWREGGRSWTEIGRGLGISRQAAQQRFGRGEHDYDRPA